MYMSYIRDWSEKKHFCYFPIVKFLKCLPFTVYKLWVRYRHFLHGLIYYTSTFLFVFLSWVHMYICIPITWVLVDYSDQSWHGMLFL